MVCQAPSAFPPPRRHSRMRGGWIRLRMSDLLAPEHVIALIVIAGSTAVLVVGARRRPGPWLRVLAGVLVVDEVSWWGYLLGGGEPGSRLALSLPPQLFGVAIFIPPAAVWRRPPPLVRVPY